MGGGGATCPPVDLFPALYMGTVNAFMCRMCATCHSGFYAALTHSATMGGGGREPQNSNMDLLFFGFRTQGLKKLSYLM